jgi:hypothetical protein
MVKPFLLVIVKEPTTIQLPSPFYGQLVPNPLFAIPPFNVYDVSKYLVVILT